MEHIVLETEHPIAADSPDHLYPYGTAMSYPINGRFIDKISRLFAYPQFTEFSILDLGCGGGTFVQALIDRGFLAVGLEGSDFSKQRKRAAWKFFSDQFLFTCDITKTFQLFRNKQPLLFDVITAWEVMEHISEENLDLFIENVKKHLKPLGLVILSITNEECFHMGHDFHVCKRPKSWWVEKFRSRGLFFLEEYQNYFNDQFIMGPKQFHFSFNLVLASECKNYRKPPKITLKEKIVDKWVYSKWQHKVSKLLTLRQ